MGGYRVQFPGLRRVVQLPYGSIASASFSATLRDLAEAGKIDILTGVQVTDVAPDYVVTGDGRRYAAALVINCRGGDVKPFESQCGYQKFFGFEIELQRGCWPDDLPVLMDADLPQFDGFSFMYVLP